MILQVNFHYEIEQKEKLVSISGKSGGEIFVALQKLLKDIRKEKIIYLDNSFQKIFAISIQKVELIKLPSKEKEDDLESFIDLVFHISCQKGINTIAFHLTNQEIQNSTVGICKSEDILKQLNKLYSQKDHPQQEKPEKKTNCFLISSNTIHQQINDILYGRKESLDQEDHQIFSLIIQKQNSNSFSSCFLSNQNLIRVLSNFQITKAQLYESNLEWSDDNNKKENLQGKEADQPKLLTAANVNVEKSTEMQNKVRYETILNLNHNIVSKRHLLFVFNEKVIAYQFPLKFKQIDKNNQIK
ncbi:unnamed protein product [Paramecium sonneborni]|uniref:Uncharacterized protein n=1 Tax=Paramecium sonneborni TaxID=65129 RepID=A0A8S1PQP5_9CILI|nr:unnamed protein product [Paramecium sonneborni]